MSLFDGIKRVLTGGGTLGSLVRTVAMGYVLNKVTASANKDTNNRNTQPGLDTGVKLQVPPASDQKIPVLYGGAYFGGIITEAVMSNSNQRMTYCITLAEKTGTLLSSSAATTYTFGDIIWDDQKVFLKADGITVDYTEDRQGNVDLRLRDLVKIYCYAGSSGSANQRFPTGYSGTAVNAYNVVPGWNSGFAMNNLIFAVVEVNYSAERNVVGIANQLTFQITSSLNKPGDVIYDYLTNGLYGANVAPAEIDTVSLTTLNTYATTSVTYTDETGSQTLPNRYQINGLINTDNGVMRNVEDVANSAGSWLSYSILTGKWGIIINRAGSSVANFNDSNIVGGISVSGTGLSELYNSVKVESSNRDIRDQTDYVSIAIPAEDRNANELDKALQLTYNFINEPVQAELLGFIELKQSRVDLVITFNTDYSLIGLQAGEIISVTNSKLGFNSKLFRIVSIAEVDSDNGLQCQFTALEYDANVYVEDLSRFTRTLNNTVTTVGNIGIPGTPTITTFQNQSRPHLVISTTAPAGIIEGMEYWSSNDTALNEAQRSYRLIATQVAPNGNDTVRGTFVTGESVTLDYDTLGSGNLVVKTRAYNSTTVGPFSANSAITSFTATQIPDAIGPNTQVFDQSGGLATVLSLVTLLNNLDGLFGNNASQAGGIFEKIFDIFKDETGYDIVGETSGGNLVVSSQLGIKDEGTLLTNAVSTINFVGSSVNSEVSGISDVIVTISDSFSSAADSTGTSAARVIQSAAVGGTPTHFIYGDIPSTFGSKISTLQYAIPGQNDSRVAVWTHPSLVYSTRSMNSPDINQRSAGQMKLAFDVSGSTTSGAPVGALKTGFFDAGSFWQSTSTTQINPNFSNLNLFANVTSAKNGNIQMYYSTCSNVDTSKSIADQTWDPWKKYTGAVDSVFSSTETNILTKNINQSKNSYPTCFGTDPISLAQAGLTPKGDLGFNKEKIKITSSINLSANSAIIFGVSVYNFESNVNFLANTIIQTGCGIYEFPGYTPTSGNVAIVFPAGGPVGGRFIASKTGSLVLSVQPTVSSIWPDTYQFSDSIADYIAGDMTSLPSEYSISKYPSDAASIDIRILG